MSNHTMFNMNVVNLQSIASAGGTVVVSASNFNVVNLQSIATAGVKSGAKLIIKDAIKLNAINCQSIASCHPGYVIFDFT